MMKSTLYADTLLHNGIIWTADPAGSCKQAIALRNGLIMATGTDDELLPLAGPDTRCIDLAGRMVMPGLIDSHMHPYWGAKLLAGFSLNYESLTPDETLARIQQHLDNTDPSAVDDWLLVRGWLRIGGSDITRWQLDQLTTSRPVMLFSNDCHFIALNSRGLARLGINKETADPPDGAILREPNGKPLGIIEDAPAMRYYDEVSYLTPEQGAAVLARAQQALHRQGVTAIMDARAEEEAFDAFEYLRQQGGLTIRVQGAVEITPAEAGTQQACEQAVEKVLNFARKYDTGGWQKPEPAISVVQAKFFVDGMLPNQTACLSEPYWEDTGTGSETRMQPTQYCGHSYFTGQQLAWLFCECARHDLHPHMHIIGDGAAGITLDAIETMRQTFPDKAIHPAMAHNDLVSPEQYPRFEALGVIANLSFQWAGLPEGMMAGYLKILDKRRACHWLETHGKFFDAGVTVAYNSDWPIDPLNEWFNFQVGLTRRLAADQPRLGTDRNLTVREVLRAATINAAKSMVKEDRIGSLEPGKFADLIVLDRNAFSIPAETFSEIKVLMTMVGGKVVWQAE